MPTTQQIIRQKRELIDKALTVQNKDLTKWSSKLNVNTYLALLNYVTRQNAKAESVEDIATGYALTTFIAQYKPTPKPF